MLFNQAFCAVEYMAFKAFRIDFQQIQRIEFLKLWMSV